MNVEQYQALAARAEEQMKAKCVYAQALHGPDGFALLNLFLAVCYTTGGKLSGSESIKLLEACMIVGRRLGLDATKIEAIFEEARQTAKELKLIDKALDIAYDQLPREDRNPSPEASVSNSVGGSPEIVVKH